MTVFEGCAAALVAALNTSRPALVPVLERDRWIDVELGPTSGSVLTLSGWEDEPLPGQNDYRTTDFRRAKLLFELWATTTAGATAAEVVDAVVEWIGRQCGPVDTGALATAGATRLELGKKTAIVAKAATQRCLVEVVLEYRNLTNDLTRAK